MKLCLTPRKQCIVSFSSFRFSLVCMFLGFFSLRVCVCLCPNASSSTYISIILQFIRQSRVFRVPCAPCWATMQHQPVAYVSMLINKQCVALASCTMLQSSRAHHMYAYNVCCEILLVDDCYKHLTFIHLSFTS